MKSDFVAVIDLGSTKVTCLAAAADGPDEMSVEAVCSVPCRGMRKGQVSDLSEVTKAINEAVRKVENELGEEVEGVVVGITGNHIEGLNTQGLKPIVPGGRKITYQDVLEVINHSREISLGSDRVQIQALPREFRVDGQRNVHKPVGLTGSKLEVVTYVVSGASASLQNVERAVADAGKKVDLMVIQPLASGIGVMTQEEMELGTAVVDIGGGTTDVAIFIHGSIAFSSSIPLGAISVTSDVGTLLKTSPDEAERLKLQYGVAVAEDIDPKDCVEVQQLGTPIARQMQRRVLCEIIESRMRELAMLIGREIEKSPFGSALPGGVTLTGGGSALSGVDKLFADALPQHRFKVSEPNLGSKFPAKAGMATAVGLASFSIHCFDEFTPAQGTLPWQDRIKSLFSMLSR